MSNFNLEELNLWFNEIFDTKKGVVIEQNLLEESLNANNNQTISFNYIGISEVTFLGEITNKLKETHKDVITVYKFNGEINEEQSFLAYGILFKNHNKYIDLYLNLNGIDNIFEPSEDNFEHNILVVVQELSKKLKKRNQEGVSYVEIETRNYNKLYNDFVYEVLKLEKILVKNTIKKLV